MCIHDSGDGARKRCHAIYISNSPLFTGLFEENLILLNSVSLCYFEFLAYQFPSKTEKGTLGDQKSSALYSVLNMAKLIILST